MLQPGLFQSEELSKQVWAKDEIVFSVDSDQTRILRNISKLYLDGKPFHCDVTYSKGVFYKKMLPPALKFDIEPQVAGVQRADARQLPIQSNFVRSLVFDPPFKASNSKVKGIIEQRFTAFNSVLTLWEFYEDALREFYRVLEPKGIAVFKCQDTVSSGINHMSHFQVEKSAEKVGFVTLDLFILQARSVLMSPNMHNQKHARKTHSFLYVFQKPRYN